MRHLLSRLGKKGLLAIGLAGVLAAAFLGWKPLATWYCVRGLAGADEGSQEKWLSRVAGLGEAAVPGLLAYLAGDDVQVCANAEAGLSRLARDWGPGDDRCRSLAEQLRDRFPSLGVPGREAVLEWQTALLGSVPAKAPLPEPLARAARDLLTAAAGQEEKSVRARALALADVLLERLEAGPWLATCRGLVCKGLADAEPDTRARAVHLTLHARFRGDGELLRLVIPLLRDGDAGVRRAALLAVGPRQAVISDEDLLPLLHDGDAGVRRLCEAALRSRGLQDEHLVLGKLISDSRASARLEVLPYLEHADVDRGVWLRRLSRAPSAAVRAAAVRAAAQSPVDLSDRLRQMAAGDPNPTVRQLAAHYLKQR